MMVIPIIPEQFKQYSAPAILAEGEHFLIKIAETTSEIAKAQELRYDVFKEEQGRLGIISVAQIATRKDKDIYDDFCIHLVVVEKCSSRIVGTYRAHPGCVALKNGIGFYSAGEYAISNLDQFAVDTIEYGRSCVAPEHRNGAVVSLLWAGIGELHSRSRKRYLMGCVSLESVDPLIGWAIYKYACSQVYTDEPSPVCGKPLEKFILPHPGESAIDLYIEQNKQKLMHDMPPLLKGYLRLGARIAGEPVLDKEFGTIDLLIWLDLACLPERYARHFMRISFK